jgi:SRSO17 transposase
MSGRPTAAQVERWADEVTAAGDRIGRHFARSEPRRRAVGYIRGLLGDAERKNGWQLAEHLGEATPDGVQHLLARADWDADAVRDDLTRYVAEHLGDPTGVLVIDETAFPKRGDHSVGVQRQYCGAVGKVENCQVGVFLGYVTARGRALLDRALYLPREWAADARRRKRAGVPKKAAFATKVELAEQLVTRAVAAGVPARWVTADAVYGTASLRDVVEGHGLGYVLAVKADHTAHRGWRATPARDVLAELRPGDWRRVSNGAGAKGPRVSDWAAVPVDAPIPGTGRWLLIRRDVADPAAVAFFICGGPSGTALDALVRVAGSRWAIEECFEIAKGGCGLDHYEVRSWIGWHRHVTLSLLALAVVAVIQSRVATGPAKKRRPG